MFFLKVRILTDDSEKSRKSKLEQINQDHFKIVISTGQYFGEGTDPDSLECLFIIYPFAFEGKLIQYIGRIQRSGKPVTIFDYRDQVWDYALDLKNFHETSHDCFIAPILIATKAVSNYPAIATTHTTNPTFEYLKSLGFNVI